MNAFQAFLSAIPDIKLPFVSGVIKPFCFLAETRTLYSISGTGMMRMPAFVLGALMEGLFFNTG